MKVDRFGVKVAIAMSLSSTVWLPAGAAKADTIPFSGSASVEVPASPAGEMTFTLTVNGEEHDFSSVDNSLGGTLTLAWVASEQEPEARIQRCGGGAPGAEIRLDEATPSANVWATWVSPTSRQTIGPVEVSEREGYAAGSVCVSERQEPEPPPSPEDPPEEDPEGEIPEEVPVEPEDEEKKEKKEKTKDRPEP